jgi:spore coat protein U-like protein
MTPALRSLAAFAALCLPSFAHALCTITCTCAVATTAVAHGGYNPISGATQSGVGNVRVTCGGVLGLLVPFTVALGPGLYDAGTFDRRMAGGTARLRYNLYTDASYSAVWGNGTGGTQTVSGGVLIALLGGTVTNVPVYGLIPANQNSMPTGSYSDTVTVTVTYF